MHINIHAHGRYDWRVTCNSLWHINLALLVYGPAFDLKLDNCAYWLNYGKDPNRQHLGTVGQTDALPVAQSTLSQH